MAHEIESDYFFSVNQAAWHKIGKVIDYAPTPEQAWELTGGHTYIPADKAAGKIGDQYVDFDGYMPIVRSDGKPISIMSDRYGLIQPLEFWRDFEPFLETGLCTIETGGVIREGRQMFGTLKIADAIREVCPNDEIRGNILGFTSWDGRTNHEIRDCNTRVVCANTLAQAQSEGSKHLFKIRHTLNMRERIEEAKSTVLQVLQNLEKNTAAYKAMVARKATKPEMVAYIHNVFEFDPKAQNSTKLVNKINHVIDLLDDQRGYDLVPAMHGTMWQAYNAVSEHCTHEYGHSVDSRIAEGFTGEAMRLNQRAMSLALN